MAKASPSARRSASAGGSKSKPRRKRARVRLENDQRRAQLLALARKIFTERAYDEVSIDDLAMAAKISKGLLYHYYPTKRDLYVASLREVAAEILTAVSSATDIDDSPVERLRAAVDAYLTHVQGLGTVYVALLRGGIGSDPEVAEVLESTRRAFLDQFLERSVMAQAIAANPILHLALRGWIGMVEATSIEWVAKPSVELPRLRDLLVDNLVAALQNAQKPASVKK